MWAKTSNFELDARVPLIIAAPNQRSAGNNTESLAELTDLYPTLVELSGLPKVDGLEGVSLAPVLTSPTQSVRAAALTQHPRPAYYQAAPEAMGYSVRTDRFRYTEWRDWKSGEIIARELYNHHVDADETRNVAGDPKRTPDVAMCASRLLEFQPVVRPGWQPALP